jgi:DegV family protein with EDD domain
MESEGRGKNNFGERVILNKIRIVTDSSADIPPQIQEELGISVVPLYVRFGDQTFKDGVTISHDEFYQRLVAGENFPNTIQPSPGDFKDTYEALVKDADGIVSIHLSEKFSGTVNSARQARDLVKGNCPIEVINSESMSIGLGLICIAAARAARAGDDLASVLKVANEAIPEAHLLVLFDSLKYLAKGGRIGKAKSLLGTLLNIKPLLSMKDGIVVPISQVRSFSKGLESLYLFLSNALKEKGNVKDLAIMYNTTPNEANKLADRIAQLYPREKIIMGRIGPILGAHAGPNLIVTCFRGAKPALL